MTSFQTLTHRLESILFNGPLKERAAPPEGRCSNAALAILSDNDLLGKLRDLSAKENEATVEFLIHLGEVERRRLYLSAGAPSIYGCLKRSDFIDAVDIHTSIIAAKIGRPGALISPGSSGRIGAMSMGMRLCLAPVQTQQHAQIQRLEQKLTFAFRPPNPFQEPLER